MKSDILIMVPIFNSSLDIKSINFKHIIQDELVNKTLKIMEPELHKSFKKDLWFNKIDDITLIFENKKYLCHTYLFYDKQSNLGVIHIYLKDTELDTTKIAHLIDNNDINIYRNQKEENIEEYIKSLKLTKCGDIRGLYNLSIDVNINIVKGIIAGGTNHRMKMTPEDYDSIKLNNISPFKNWPMYVGIKEAVQQNITSSLLLNDNSWIIYQISIAIMQYTAVYKANKNIEKELRYKHSIDENKSLKIIEEFGICNNLFSCNMFAHSRSRELAEKLRDIFDTDKRYELYKDNKQILFDIAQLRNDINNQKENDMLLIFTIVVGVSGVLDLFADWLQGHPGLDYIIGIPSILTVIWTIWMIKRIKNKRK